MDVKHGRKGRVSALALTGRPWHIHSRVGFRTTVMGGCILLATLRTKALISDGPSECPPKPKSGPGKLLMVGVCDFADLRPKIRQIYVPFLRI